MQKEHRERRGREIDAGSAKMTFREASAIHMQRLEERVTIKRRTRKYWKETLVAMLKSWPGLSAMEVRKITPNSCRDWATRYARTASSNRYNNSIALLRHVIDVAKESGVVYSNPAEDLERVTVRGKKLDLPTLSQFAAFIAELRNAHSRDTQNCADLAEGLAYTGVRIGESAEIEWRDLAFDAGEIFVQGDPQEATKNGEVRRVPMIPQARALLAHMRENHSASVVVERLFQSCIGPPRPLLEEGKAQHPLDADRRTPPLPSWG